jgi:hypothetical protein
MFLNGAFLPSQRYLNLPINPGLNSRAGIHSNSYLMTSCVLIGVIPGVVE